MYKKLEISSLSCIYPNFTRQFLNNKLIRLGFSSIFFKKQVEIIKIVNNNSKRIELS